MARIAIIIPHLVIPGQIHQIPLPVQLNLVPRMIALRRSRNHPAGNPQKLHVVCKRIRISVAHCPLVNDRSFQCMGVVRQCAILKFRICVLYIQAQIIMYNDNLLKVCHILVYHRQKLCRLLLEFRLVLRPFFRRFFQISHCQDCHIPVHRIIRIAQACAHKVQFRMPVKHRIEHIRHGVHRYSIGRNINLRLPLVQPAHQIILKTLFCPCCVRKFFLRPAFQKFFRPFCGRFQTHSAFKYGDFL